ncbi:rhomboid family intramembrane serine protease [Demequina zhanjiangensis]|uniref:Rhomboid family intramembrane serine protease n=1 Tax=Demequina zhanjiangensis TaxID=3051659 RepID=A0ABT8G004_9MICO|nr:rhomboid family intramembrane serine protease [Demequina sp. SYSU T00b26]MDN4472407.1 rhomboid family intramembrane serine protease [Demequina sp. SYSU T00b26]
MTASGGGTAMEPVCPRHPDRVSYVSCQRCGRPTCPDCQTPAPVGIICVDCAREAQKQSRSVVNRLGFTSAFGRPVVTLTLIGLNVAAYLYGYLVLGQNAWALEWGMIPALNGELGGAGEEWYRWITSGFLHFGIFHIGMNMLVLFQFGSQLEPILGRMRFLALYVLSLLGGSLGVDLLARGGIHGGASGAIFGLFAAYAVVLYKLKLNYQSVVTTGGLWLVLGFIVPGLSWQAHLGGAVAGAAVMLGMLHWVNSPQRARRR